MGRTPISVLKSYKFSMNIAGENKKAVDDMTFNYGMKYGPFLNFLIKKVCLMPDSMREFFIDACLRKCDELNEKIELSSDLEKKSYEQEKKSYLEMARIFNAGKEITYSGKEDPSMAKYRMKDGYLIVPKEWIVLNPQFEGEYRFAGVVECRNSAKYDIPHFVFFTDTRYACDYDDYFRQTVQEWCIEKWPRFREIIRQEVKLVSDPENPGKYLNAEEHLASPVIGLFHILRNDDELFDNNPPCGAMIVSTGTSEDENEEI